MRIPVVAIIGRPNAGKSTLFNSILGYRKAIVEDLPGVTRDRHYALVERFEIPFYLVDTGGFESDPKEELAAAVVGQTMIAVEEADVIIALFDGTVGFQSADAEIVKLLRRSEKQAVYVVNKCDGVEQVGKTADFYTLGVPELLDISALNGRGIKGLVAQILPQLPEYEKLKQEAENLRARIEEAEAEASKSGIEILTEEEEEIEARKPVPREIIPNPVTFAPVFVPGQGEESEVDYDMKYQLAPLPELAPLACQDEEDDEEEMEEEIGQVRVAIIGRPNVGKSTLVNTILGETRVIASPVAGTTRDSLDVEIERDGQKYVLTDTAGLRKQARVSDDIEKYSVFRALTAIKDCDVAILLIDASAGPTDQDTKIAGIAIEEGRGLVLGINKWDLVEKDHKTAHEFKENVREAFKFAPFAPLVFLSAKSGRRAESLLKEARRIALVRKRRVGTGKLNRVLQRSLKSIVPSSYRGRPVKLSYASQVDVAPPRFLLFFNYPEKVHFSYLRAIKNIIRDQLGFSNTEVKFVLKEKN